MTDVDGKYVVFKREDWDQFCRGMGEGGVHVDGTEGIYITELCDRVLEDAVVLREQDIHCAGALYAYAASVMATHEIMEQMGADPDSREMRDLDKIVDWASGTADRARQFGKRVPTL
jgi:hypothetical protein